MSSMPDTAMSDARPSPETEGDEGSAVTLKERAGKLAASATALARDNPKTAIAAGAALLAGAVAAAAIPTVRAARKSASGKSASSGTARRSTSAAARKKKS